MPRKIGKNKVNDITTRKYWEATAITVDGHKIYGYGGTEAKAIAKARQLAYQEDAKICHEKSQK